MKSLSHPDSDTRRRMLLGLLAGGLSLPAVLRQALAQQGPALQGLRSVQGDVRVNGQPAAQGTLVLPGDTVSTARGAMAMFVVGQDAYLMREDSRAELTGVAQIVDVLRLATGRLMGVFGKGGDRRIVTPSATIGIRGTGAYLEAEDGRSYFCLCYGSAEIATTDGAARDAYSTRHHDSPRYIYGDGRANAIVSASVSNHTDAELIMLEALTGRQPPQSVLDGPMMSNPYR
ncbi:MAG: hypothetical protein NT115_09380 [Proteobacteria bacterium]|nr:hypothetical protein [Pseudomonadota bacterium]